MAASQRGAYLMPLSLRMWSMVIRMSSPLPPPRGSPAKVILASIRDTSLFPARASSLNVSARAFWVLAMSFPWCSHWLAEPSIKQARRA